MRTMSIDEELITGSASDKEKFIAWAKTIPHALRNPLYHIWNSNIISGIDELLNEDTALDIHQEASKKLLIHDNSCQKLIKGMNVVEVICTTEDPTDSLEHD
ncbi:glucuronate isomerase [Flagellimonas sp.]|uniref:glucuronate isomerase n=1 Tax=Flagellimonas sp. TaxID=2058762 RepID=UPI003BB12285